MKPFQEASEDFWSAFCGCGTLVSTCACGRTRFASHSGGDFEEGELEELQAKAKEDPDHYIEDAENDSVSVIDMPGGLILWGCPCHRARNFENFLLDYRRQILDYYRRITAKEASMLALHQSSLAEAQGGAA